ncbi:3-isopropylmalate dehydratase small subunit [Neisseria macacae ATCC 33926]|uniref:3-isopropylmalate dehydratase small subunit n=1 Tax=Neisseria macacae ATCC 33926 TaxID=997348 RepID=A0AA36UHQ5_9NEIS|nr:3-isopropylmalate dehydratase small subunit [Neisseria macacae ATCC 33926]
MIGSGFGKRAISKWAQPYQGNGFLSVCRESMVCGLYAAHPKAAPSHSFAIGWETRQACPLC